MNNAFRPMSRPKLPAPSFEWETEGEEEEPMGEIQGQTPGSREEWRVALGLNALGHSYIYQYRFIGIRRVRGEVKVDFLITTTVPWSTLLEVQSDYWHGGSRADQDRLRTMLIQAEAAGEFQFKEVFGQDLTSVEHAYDTLLAVVGRR